MSSQYNRSGSQRNHYRSENNRNVKRGPGICYDFQKGKCQRGEACRFKHEQNNKPRETTRFKPKEKKKKIDEEPKWVPKPSPAGTWAAISSAGVSEGTERLRWPIREKERKKEEEEEEEECDIEFESEGSITYDE